MKLFTLRHWAVLTIMLLAGPAWAQPVWNSVVGAAGASGTNVQTVVDGAGNTIVAGSFTQTLTLGGITLNSAGGTDLFVARLSYNGTWTQAVRAGGTGDDFAYGIAVDGAGTVTVVGFFGTLVGTSSATFGANTLTSAGAADIFVARLSAAGVWTQAVRAGGTGDDYGQAVALDATGNATICGTFSNTVSFGATTLTSAGSGDIYIARLSAAGIWTQAAQAGGPNYDSTSSIVLDGAGNATIAGFFASTATFGSTTLTSAGNSDIVVAKLSTAGSWTYAVRAGGTDSDFGSRLAVDGAGNTTCIGYFFGTSQFGNFSVTSAGRADIVVARLSPAGVWTQAARAGGPDLDIPSDLVLDGNGNVLVTGFFTNTAFFGATPLMSAGGRDIFVASLSGAGNWSQAIRAGGPSDDLGTSVAISGTGSTTVVGIYGSTATFGAFTLTSPTGGAFVARLNGLVTASRAAMPAEIFTLAPNPATAQVRLAWPEAATGPRPLQVLDNLGRQVRQHSLPAHATNATLDVQGLVPGLYLVRCGGAMSRLVIE